MCACICICVYISKWYDSLKESPLNINYPKRKLMMGGKLAI